MLSFNMNDTPFGRAALAKLGKVPENFAIFYAGWCESGPEYQTMRVTGAAFDDRERRIPRTTQSVVLTKEELSKF